jgi:hypothetical protein
MKINTFQGFLNESSAKLEALKAALTETQLNFLGKYSNLYDCSLNSKGEVDVNRDVTISGYTISHLPLQFGKVDGHFTIANSDIVSLSGAPREVTGMFQISYCNNLTSLELGPKKVYDYRVNHCKGLKSLKGAPLRVETCFSCSQNENLTSLVGGPRYVGENFYCSENTALLTLEGAPEEVGESFFVEYCERLTSLKGAPRIVPRRFSCYFCKSLTSLEGAPEEVGEDFQANSCLSLTTLKGMTRKIGGRIFCGGCPKLAPEEGVFVDDKDLLRSWLESGLSIEDFLHKKRGTLKGKEFGF